jgi:hypothetical protein
LLDQSGEAWSGGQAGELGFFELSAGLFDSGMNGACEHAPYGFAFIGCIRRNRDNSGSMVFADY